MAQYPVTDHYYTIDSLNYLLSGPSALGQDLAGFSSDITGDLTGNYRSPYTAYNGGALPNISLYVAPIALGTSEMLDERTWKFTFASAAGSPPFIPGQPILVTGVADPAYDGYYSPIGVIECTTTYVIARTIDAYPIVAASTGGTVEFSAMDTDNSTDCNAKVTVTGTRDRVLLNAQLNNSIFTDPTYHPGSYYYTISINRYVAAPSTVPNDLGSIFLFDKTIVSKQYLISTPPPLVSNDVESIFIGIVDEPGLGNANYKGGYYWYILEVRYEDNAGGQIVTGSVLGLRSFSAQVVKP